MKTAQHVLRCGGDSRRTTWFRPLIAILTIAVTTAASADDPSSADVLKAMHRRVASLKVTAGPQPAAAVKLVETPLLRYSNPGGLTVTTDGAVWAWGTTGRPKALTAIFFEQLPDNGGSKWSCELTALADEPVTVTSAAGWEWSPPHSGTEWKKCPEAPAVAESANERLRQMKDLARQFTSSESFPTQTDELRLLIRPIHRYSDAANGLIDGALFAFSAGTNPESVLALEAVAEAGGERRWQYAFFRMGAAATRAKRGESIVWERPAIDVWVPKEPYFSAFGTDRDVFNLAEPME